jgi:hypothetical protein
MANETRERVGLAHGAMCLPGVKVLSYNVELKDDGSFVGDRANKGAFRRFIENWRKPMREIGEDPFGEVPSRKLVRKRLDAMLASGEQESARIIQGAIESFASELAAVTCRFLKLRHWKEAERIVMGGGLSGSRVGQLAIGRASALLKAEKINTEISIIHNDPNEAGLIGAVRLVPTWIFAGHDAALGVDIGGTNIRAGVVRFKSPDIAEAKVWNSELWRQSEQKPSRDEAVGGLIRMLKQLIDCAAKADLNLAPFINIGCPGRINSDATIEAGGQNLPDNWESRRFNLPQSLREAIPAIYGRETIIVMHNDAVVQGLGEWPFMRDVSRWGIFTIGTGLGNALFSSR